MAVEEELVLAADRVAEGEEGGVVARPGDEHLLAVLGLAHVVRGGGEVHEQLRAGEREIGRRRAGLPDVLADRRPDERAAEPEEDELAAGGEVAVLVEDAVVGEEALPVDRLDLAAGADRARVEEVAVEPRGADERDDVDAGGRDLAQRRLGRPHERRAQEQVLGRIARDRELRQERRGRRLPRVRRREQRECAGGFPPDRRRRC